METKEIRIRPNEVWKILKKGDEICIVDHLGRSRHQSKTQMMTAMHLAMRLAESPLQSIPNADEALRYVAKEFENG